MISLSKLGHEIGLHSNTHPTNMKSLNKTEQAIEYFQNKKKINQKIKKKKIISMSHPCGSYNLDTIKILKKLEIEIGFRSDLKRQKSVKNRNLQIPRMDHSIIVNSIKT